ncbi:MAG: sigma-E processing peptidase SpoIIGA [Ruminococcus sp.]|nr:sigma-E processing peptidase SpoIIGA [Ruminococcus sp.]MCM1480756.1 sigma-E processing peptidase SpoIIGA [Muribaculaceae bacterium]
MYIYVDALIITSIYANFFLLKTTARLTHSPLRNGRCVAAAMAGSIFSLVILLPRLGNILLLLIRLLSAALMIIAAFGNKPMREILRTGLIFLFVSFIFAGIEYGFSVLTGGQNVIWHNSVLYVNISLLTLVISTIISYAAISAFRYYIDGKNSLDAKYAVTVTREGKSVSFAAVGDTCNNLTDVFTGKPVIVCGREDISKLFRTAELDKVLSENNSRHIEGWRLIPFSTISSGGMLPIFAPECVILKNEETGKRKSVSAYIGVVDRDMEHAVFNPKIL